MTVCTATTKSGEPCKATAKNGLDVCNAHAPEEVKERLGFGGSQPGAGRPRNPSKVEVLREKLEAEWDEWFGVLTEARNATRHVVVGNGPTAHVEEIPDLPTRLAAFREIMDRAHGKPKQTAEVSGNVGVTLADLAGLVDDAG